MQRRLERFLSVVRKAIASFLCSCLRSRNAISKKPTIVVVTGAWHTPSHYGSLLAALHSSGHGTKCLALPSLNPRDPGTASSALDATFVREQMLLPLIEEGKEILFVLHSYGGLPGSAAAKGLSVSERRSKGLKGGIVGQVFVASLVAQSGESMLSSIGGEWLDFMVPNEETGFITVRGATKLFYFDAPPPQALDAEAGLLPHAITALTSPSPPPSWPDEAYEGRRVYIRCTQDVALPLEAQEAYWKKTGLSWITRDLKAGHSPFLSLPQEMATLLISLAEELQGYNGPRKVA